MRRLQWMGIALGAALLLTHWPAGSGRGSADPVRRTPAEVREHLAGVLERWNPSLDAFTDRRIAEAILRCSEHHSLSPYLVLAVILVESTGRPAALSPKGAVGLMQVMPDMYARLSMPGNPTHIETNIEAGCLLLADNVRRLGEEDGISAYFWGSHIRGDGYLRSVRDLERAVAGFAKEEGRARSTS